MDDEVFRALADASRRTLLDRLFERDGQTLGELEAALPGMTRFGVMKHLRVLEAAGLVTSRKVGRERHHYLNPVPIRRIHDRWLDRYRIRAADLLDDLEASTGGTDDHAHRAAASAAPPRYVHTTFIRSHAGTHLAGADRLELHAPLLLQLDRPLATGPSAARTSTGSSGDPAIEGVILESDPPRRLAMSFHALWYEAVRADAPSTDDRSRSTTPARRLEAHRDPRGPRGPRRRPATRSSAAGR